MVYTFGQGLVLGIIIGIVVTALVLNKILKYTQNENK